MFKEIKKGDVLLLAAFLAAALLIALSPALRNTLSSHRNHKEENAVLEIRIAGDLYGSYSLYEDQTLEIHSSYGNNTLTISGGTAAMTASDCKNQICVRSGVISKPGQMIVCLPHRLSAEILPASEFLPPSGEALDSDTDVNSDAGSDSSPYYDAIVR